MGGWRYGCTILDLGTRWRWVVSFMARPLYTRGNSSRSGRCGEVKEPCHAGNQTLAVQPVARPSTDELSRL
jgi:hypothetical protein